MRGRRFLILGGGLIAAAVLLFALRPGDDDDPEPEAVTTVATTRPATVATTAPPATTEPPATTTPAPRPRPRPRPQNETVTVPISVRGGRPVGGVARPSVRRGRRVRLVIRSDVADHVHLHGYDIMRDIAPGRPGEIVFRATIPGRFEVELEDRGLQIAELEVRP